MSKIIKNYFYNIFYQLFIIITPLITAPYLAHTLGADTLGTSSYVTSVASIFCTIGLLGIYNYGCREIAYVRDNEDKLTYTFYELMLIRIIMCVITTIIYTFIFRDSEYKMYIYIYYLWILANFLDISWLYVGLEDMKITTLKNFAAKFLSILGIFVFVKSPEDLWIYIVLLSFPTFIANISVYFQLKKYIGYPKFSINNLSRHLNNSFKLFLPQVASMIYLQVDKVMIEFFTESTKQVAYYDYAEKIVKMPLAFITAFSIVMMPRIANEFSKKKSESITLYIKQAIIFSAFLSFPIFFGIASLAPNLIPWYLGIEFSPVIGTIIIISPIILTNAFSSISGTQYFTATNQIKILTKSYSYAAIINLIVNIVLIPKIGFYGAAIGTLIAELICVVMQYYYLSKQIKLETLVYKIFKYLLVSIIMCIVVSIIGNFLEPKISTTIIQIISGLITYISILVISKDEFIIDTIKKIIVYLQKKDKIYLGMR